MAITLSLFNSDGRPSQTAQKQTQTMKLYLEVPPAELEEIKLLYEGRRQLWNIAVECTREYIDKLQRWWLFENGPDNHYNWHDPNRPTRETKYLAQQIKDLQKAVDQKPPVPNKVEKKEFWINKSLSAILHDAHHGQTLPYFKGKPEDLYHRLHGWPDLPPHKGGRTALRKNQPMPLIDTYFDAQDEYRKDGHSIDSLLGTFFSSSPKTDEDKEWEAFLEAEYPLIAKLGARMRAGVFADFVESYARHREFRYGKQKDKVWNFPRWKRPGNIESSLLVRAGEFDLDFEAETLTLKCPKTLLAGRTYRIARNERWLRSIRRDGMKLCDSKLSYENGRLYFCCVVQTYRYIPEHSGRIAGADWGNRTEGHNRYILTTWDGETLTHWPHPIDANEYARINYNAKQKEAKIARSLNERLRQQDALWREIIPQYPDLRRRIEEKGIDWAGKPVFDNADRKAMQTCAMHSADYVNRSRARDPKAGPRQRKRLPELRRSQAERKARTDFANIKKHATNVLDEGIKRMAHDLMMQYDTLYLEDLKIGNMSSNPNNRQNKKGLNRTILEGAFGKLRDALTRAATKYDRRVVQVSAKNTSKLCSACGEINKGLKAELYWTCPACGTEHQRDANAARNIRQRGIDSETMAAKAS